MDGDPSDPTQLSHIAVTVEDVVVALETHATTARTAVLRVTPPFSGRMRARLHVGPGLEAGDGPAPVRIEPDRLLDPDAPAYPRPAETEDALRADPDATFTPAVHRNRHVAAVEAWRQAVSTSLADRATIETQAGETTVAVHPLGTADRS